MIEEILIILHVADGIHIIIHNVIWYNYMNSNTKTSIIILIFVQIFDLVTVSKMLPLKSIFQDLSNEI